ncbi:MAG: hypothetical protein PHT94_00910 [Candidatus Nanoarchaeia archaeon]|nr:hypothetical protein [Candidatus Nanoarchaeia archaeon]
MSMLSILQNKNIIIEKIKELESYNFDSHSQLAGYVLSQCLKTQYDMMRNNLNSNMIKKRHFNNDVKGYELIKCLYQHIYNHNYIAMNDEIFEVQDAVNNYYNKVKFYKNKEDLYNSSLLICEEIIDVFHFILQYTALLEEHYQITLIENKNHFNNSNLEYYYVEDNKFSRQVYEMLLNEGNHIITYLYSNNAINFNISDISYNYYDNYMNLFSLNRDFIRNCNFKDWKQYSDTYYDSMRFGTLFTLNRKMYAACINLIISSIPFINRMLENDNLELDKANKNDVYKFIYGVYMAKNNENIRRQLEDPRYTGKENGTVIGVEV